MNEKDKNPNYKRIYDFIAKEFKKTNFFARGVYDETFFSLRVYEMCKKISKKLEEDVKDNFLLSAALLHDIGKTDLNMERLLGDPKSSIYKEEWKLHAEKGIPIAKRFLKSEGHSDDFITEVCYLIKNHDRRKDEIDEKNMELEILQDADLLADCGKVGIARSFMYTGQKGLSVLGNIRFLKNADSRIEDDSILNLEISKKMGETLRKEEAELIEHFSEDLDSELLD